MQSAESANDPYILLGEIGPGSSAQGLPSGGVATADERIMQGLTTVYITSMYYSALSNLYIQSVLPDDQARLDAEMPRLKTALGRSYFDFTAAAGWLAENGGEFIATSTAKHYYDEVLKIGKDTVKDISAVYAQRQNGPQ
jgi:hypothetical protein